MSQDAGTGARGRGSRSGRAPAAEHGEGNRLNDDFLATLSHELRTPLTGIMLWIGVLESDSEVAATETAAEALPILSQSAELLLGMVEDLLDLSRLEAGRLRLERRPADLGTIARQAIAAFRPRIEEESGIVMVAEIDPELPHVLADPIRMKKVVGHLLSNAKKFTEAPGQVTVRAHGAEGGTLVQLEVTDTGSGIAPDILPHVFDGFRRRAADQSRPRRGLGIGLALARAIVEAHGGRIVVKTEVGEGSTFTVELPAAADAHGDGTSTTAVPAASEPPTAAAAEGDGATVLLVEDTRATRQALATILVAHGYRVLEAATGAEAVHLARTDSPDAILLDIGMPDIDGISALAKLRDDASTAAIPVAALTAASGPEDQGRIAAADFDSYLTKPFRVPELLTTLERLVSRQASHPPTRAE